MEYTKRLINVYTSLRHSNLLEGKQATEESLTYFQMTLNMSIPCTSQEKLASQILRQTLKHSPEESYKFIVGTKQWHLCLCSTNAVLRRVLGVPQEIAISYDNRSGYKVTLRQQAPVAASLGSSLRPKDRGNNNGRVSMRGNSNNSGHSSREVINAVTVAVTRPPSRRNSPRLGNSPRRGGAMDSTLAGTLSLMSSIPPSSNWGDIEVDDDAALL